MEVQGCHMCFLLQGILFQPNNNVLASLNLSNVDQGRRHSSWEAEGKTNQSRRQENCSKILLGVSKPSPQSVFAHERVLHENIFICHPVYWK